MRQGAALEGYGDSRGCGHRMYGRHGRGDGTRSYRWEDQQLKGSRRTIGQHRGARERNQGEELRAGGDSRECERQIRGRRDDRGTIEGATC